MLRHNTTIAVAIASGGTTSEGIPNREHVASGVIMPSALTSTTLKFDVSNDGVSWTRLYDENNVEISKTVAAQRAYPVPIELFGFPFFRLILGSAEAQARTLYVCFQS